MGAVTPDVVVAGKDAIGQRIAADFDSQGRRALSARGVFTVALSGGSLASQCFPSLALLPFDWSHTEFFWADERAVPPSDPESNYSLAHSLWLGPAGVPVKNIHRMPADGLDLDRAARDYAEELVSIAGSPPRLDLALLGAGADGHIASLFPGHPVAGEEQRLVAAVEDAPKPPPRRLTLTMPVLANSGRVAVVALGREKAAAIRDALAGTRSTPLATLVKRAAGLRFLIDEEAASLLSNKVE
jgi:6-phosphogluconolactonase